MARRLHIGNPQYNKSLTLVTWIAGQRKTRFAKAIFTCQIGVRKQRDKAATLGYLFEALVHTSHKVGVAEIFILQKSGIAGPAQNLRDFDRYRLIRACSGNENLVAENWFVRHVFAGQVQIRISQYQVTRAGITILRDFANVLFQCRLSQTKTNNQSVFEYAGVLVLLASNPVSLSYIGLATVHLIAMHCYLKHEDCRALACCAGLACLFYLCLAYLHSLSHS